MATLHREMAAKELCCCLSVVVVLSTYSIQFDLPSSNAIIWFYSPRSPMKLSKWQRCIENQLRMNCAAPLSVAVVLQTIGTEFELPNFEAIRHLGKRKLWSSIELGYWQHRTTAVAQMASLPPFRPTLNAIATAAGDSNGIEDDVAHSRRVSF